MGPQPVGAQAQPSPLPPAPTTNNNTSNKPPNNNNHKTTVVVPYITKTAEKFKRLCKSRGIQVHFKRHQHPQNSYGQPKGQGPQSQSNRGHLPVPIPHINCPSSYIGESGRSWGKELRSTSRPPPPYISTAPPQTPHGPLSI